MKRPEYYDYTYDMFIASIDNEQSEAVRFSEWIDDARRDGVYAFELPRLSGQTPLVRARRANEAIEVLNFSSYNYLDGISSSRSSPTSSISRCVRR